MPILFDEVLDAIRRLLRSKAAAYDKLTSGGTAEARQRCHRTTVLQLVQQDSRY